VPLTVKALRCVGKPFMELLADESSRAATQANGAVTREMFLSNVLQ
jgi:hypothetical protein